MIGLRLIPDVMQDNSADLGILVAWIVGIGVILTRTPVGKILSFVFRKLFNDPFAQWFQKQTSEALQPEVARLDKRIDTLSKKVDHDHRRITRDVSDITRRLARIPTTGEHQ